MQSQKKKTSSNNGTYNESNEIAILAMYWEVKAKETKELLDLAEYVLEAEKLIGMSPHAVDELQMKIKSLSKMTEECKRIAEALRV